MIIEFVCNWRGHRRSGRRAKFNYDEQQWKSVCKRCGTPLVRVDENQWVPCETEQHNPQMGARQAA
jgi:hypothetical protein